MPTPSRETCWLALLVRTAYAVSDIVLKVGRCGFFFCLFLDLLLS